MNKFDKGQFWEISLGQNPQMKASWPLYAGLSKDVCLDGKNKPALGHNVTFSCEFSSGTNLLHFVCLSPIYVKDLAGRIIHIGHGPEVKLDSEWSNTGKHLFPRFCKFADHVAEDRFRTSFRNLDMALSARARRSGADDFDDPLMYRHPNLYPYKLRLDTFYVDGWRIPQTEYLFTESDGLTLSSVESAVSDFFKKWEERGDSNYEEWCGIHGGEDWFEHLFRNGVTVIPTFEAHNGYNKVSGSFELEGYWPGRCVTGLHNVVDRYVSDAPEGTILKVIRPGAATSRRIVPADVIVSDGSRYKSPHADDPRALIPDIRLPHTRSVAVWGACHVPTHPSHFEKPALWGWDDQTGRFLQARGPIWDPLHYYYPCVDRVISSINAADEAGVEFAPVPSDMILKFHPVSEMNGFDSIDQAVFESRKTRGSSINSAIRRNSTTQAVCTLGYHPLPLEFEFELDNWWFPELAPSNRRVTLTPQLPSGLRPMPIIRSDVTPADYANSVEGQPTWISSLNNLKIASGRPLEDYPFLSRYLRNEKDMNIIASLCSPHLEEVSDAVFSKTAHQIWRFDRELQSKIERTNPGFLTALMDFRDRGLELTRIRHDLYQRDPDVYLAAYWFMLPLDDLLELLTPKDDSAEATASAMQSTL